MGLQRTGDLAIAILIFWVPAFFLTLFVCTRQGFKRQAGWLMLLFLAICRVISGASTIAYQTESNPSSGVYTCAAITGSLGISFVLTALAGVQLRVFDGMNRDTFINPRIIRLIYLAITVAIILSVVASNKLSPPASDVSTAHSLQKAATIIYLVVFLVLCAFEALMFINVRHILHGEKRLAYAAGLALPFTAVRLLYSIIAVFGHSKDFSIFDPNIWMEAFMQVLMEMIIATLLISAGLTTEPQQTKQVAPSAYDMEQGQPARK